MKNGNKPAGANQFSPQDYKFIDPDWDGTCKQLAQYQTGLTKREYIAGHALAGLMASYDPEKGINEVSDPQHAARIALLHADALLEALEE